MIGLLDMQQRMRENIYKYIYIKLGFVVHTKQKSFKLYRNNIHLQINSYKVLQLSWKSNRRKKLNI